MAAAQRQPATASRNRTTDFTDSPAHPDEDVPSNEPYIGLRPFHRAERNRFFGRSTEAQAIMELWRSHRVTVVHGPSGVGKTSLLRAGVLPQCERDDTYTLPVARVTTSAPLPTHRHANYNPYTVSLLAAWSPGASAPTVGHLTVAQFLLDRLGRVTGSRPVYVVIDQFEEFLHDLPHRRPFQEGFANQLGHALDEITGLRLLLAVHEEFLPRMREIVPTLGTAVGGRFAVPPLSREAALEAVTGPLQATWRSYAPGAAERLVDRLLTDRTADGHSTVAAGEAVAAGTIEPARLQVVCQGLWDTLPDSVTTISARRVEQFGDVDRTLTDLCRQAVADVAAQEGLAEHDLWQWLDEAFVTDLDTRGSLYEGTSTTGWMPNSVPRALEQHDVLQSEVRARSRRFELAHDRLIKPIQLGAEVWLAAAGPRVYPATVQSLRLAETALASGRPDVAAQRAREAVQHGGMSPDRRACAEAEAILGKLVLGEGDAAAAEAHFRSAAELFGALPDTAAVGRVLADIGALRHEQGRFTEAIDEFAAAVAHAPDDLDIKVDYARAYWGAGQSHAAIATLSSILTISPGHVEALVLRGRVLVGRGDTREGLGDLVRALHLDPDVGGRAEVAEARRWANENDFGELTSENLTSENFSPDAAGPAASR